VHYRLAPELGPLIKNKIAGILDRAPTEKLELLCGKSVIEIKPPSFNKGVAVCELMKSPPFAQRTPLFVGDDITDESVFAALPALGGFGYSVGREMAGSKAHSAVRRTSATGSPAFAAGRGSSRDERIPVRACGHRQRRQRRCYLFCNARFLSTGCSCARSPLVMPWPSTARLLAGRF
jgi:hypothetical protein